MNRTQSLEKVHWGTIFLEDSLQAIDLLFQVESVYTKLSKKRMFYPFLVFSSWSLILEF